MGSAKKNEFAILKKPRLTEKGAIISSESNAYVFEVHPDANKQEIKRAVEKIFEVKVTSVKTMNCMGKLKRVGAHLGKQKDWKKAYVSVAAGQSIEVIEGL